jgi:hypothetical protein
MGEVFINLKINQSWSIKYIVLEQKVYPFQKKSD